MNLLRTIAFQASFYVVTLLYMTVTLPFLPFLPRKLLWKLVVLVWIRSALVLLRVFAGIRMDVKGRENIPPGPLLVAAKHQSAWETLALLTLFRDPTFILKRELMRIPLFGWYLSRAGMIPIDRGGKAATLKAMGERAQKELADGRQILIFPEGTRRPVGAAPAYKFGVAHLYSAFGVPCLPVAHNAGLFWPRRGLMRPGTVRVEILPALPADLPRGVFMTRIEETIETATNQLVERGCAELGISVDSESASPSQAT